MATALGKRMRDMTEHVPHNQKKGKYFKDCECGLMLASFDIGSKCPRCGKQVRRKK